MPLLDVSDVLADPDFADTMTVARSVQTVGDNGRVQISSQTIPISGVVTSDAGDILERVANGSRLKGSITVHTTFQLVASDGDTDADVITWAGREYTVASVNDYSRYGAGFVAASCDLKPLQ